MSDHASLHSQLFSEDRRIDILLLCLVYYFALMSYLLFCFLLFFLFFPSVVRKSVASEIKVARVASELGSLDTKSTPKTGEETEEKGKNTSFSVLFRAH